MEIINTKKKFLMIILGASAIFTFLTGCNKKFWDYDCAWVSEKPYIYLPLGHEQVIIELNGERKEVVTASTADGEQIEFYNGVENGSLSDEQLIWIADVEVKKGELYLTIKTDNYGDCEGEVYILKQEDVK